MNNGADSMIPAGTGWELPTSQLFGIVIPGNPVSTQVQQIAPFKWSAALGYSPKSFVIFLTMVEPLPTGYGVGLYLAREDTMEFEYLGQLTQHRPSTFLDVPVTLLNPDEPVRVVLGLSLEREEDLANMGETQHQRVQQAYAETKMAISERILEDLYNFVSSYARCMNVSQVTMLPPNEEYVVMPASFVDKWRARVTTKMRKDASFWQ